MIAQKNEILVIFDTETTGINTNSSNPAIGHKIIEIGAVKIVNRRITNEKFHVFLNPKRLIEQEAIDVHGITDEMLLDKPKFEDIIYDWFDFIKDATLVAHNADFDVNFFNQEFSLLDINHIEYGTKLESKYKIIDSLKVAKDKPEFESKRKSLDALCNYYNIDKSLRDKEGHGALLDSILLAQVYLEMTKQQHNLEFKKDTKNIDTDGLKDIKLNLRVIKAQDDEVNLHQEYLAKLNNQK